MWGLKLVKDVTRMMTATLDSDVSTKYVQHRYRLVDLDAQVIMTVLMEQDVMWRTHRRIVFVILISQLPHIYQLGIVRVLEQVIYVAQVCVWITMECMNV